MTSRKGSRSAEYPVGYGRPPKETRFPAGKSGNPRGRPKGSRTIGAVLRDILQQKIAVTENGKTRRMAALGRLVNDAMRSDAKAVKLLLALVDRYAETTEARAQLSELLAEDREILAQYLLEPRESTLEPKAEDPAPEPANVDEGGRGDAD